MTNTAVKIHHATLANAEKNGVELKIVKDGVQALHKETGKKTKAASAKEAVAKILNIVESGDEPDASGEIVKTKYKKLYAPNGGNCGDALAKTLTLYRANAANTETAFIKVCNENKIDPKRWEGRNHGLQWMALSNILRNRVRKGQAVTISGASVTSL